MSGTGLGTYLSVILPLYCTLTNLKSFFRFYKYNKLIYYFPIVTSVILISNTFPLENILKKVI